VLDTDDIEEGTANLYFPGFGTTAGTALEGNTVIPAAYTDSDVDAHLNKTPQTTDGLVLSLSGNDYTWVAQSSGGGGTVTEITTTGPITGGTINTTGAIGITQASGSEDGFLSSADWNTFNNKSTFDGQYSSLTDAPTLATVATSGSYNDLSDQPTIPAAYTDADVDTHLNKSSAASGEVLSWNGNNYDWIAQSSSSGGTVTNIATTAPITGGSITTSGTIGISQASTNDDGYISSTDWNTFNSKQSTSEKGAANGYAPLDANQKVPTDNLPDSLVGAVVYQGTWDAANDTPTLPSPDSSNNGHYYIVSVAGTYSGITYAVGDWAISNGIDWEKVDNTQDVNSVFGRQGNVVANASDYSDFYDANVQSNWTETDSSSDAFILNKPTTITQAQADAIATNSAKTSFPGFGTTAGTALEGNTSFIEGTTATQTAVTEIKTLTSEEYGNTNPKLNNVMYVII
jgi:hypothetical protein